MEQFYNLFISTLNLILLPNKQQGISYFSTIQDNLTELEGDYHTFLYKDDVVKLVEKGYIPYKVIEKVELIKQQIDGIERGFWEPIHFISNEKWKNIRSVVIIDILIKM